MKFVFLVTAFWAFTIIPSSHSAVRPLAPFRQTLETVYPVNNFMSVGTSMFGFSTLPATSRVSFRMPRPEVKPIIIDNYRKGLSIQRRKAGSKKTVDADSSTHGEEVRKVYSLQFERTLRKPPRIPRKKAVEDIGKNLKTDRVGVTLSYSIAPKDEWVHSLIESDDKLLKIQRETDRRIIALRREHQAQFKKITEQNEDTIRRIEIEREESVKKIRKVQRDAIEEAKRVIQPPTQQQMAIKELSLNIESQLEKLNKDIDASIARIQEDSKLEELQLELDRRIQQLRKEQSALIEQHKSTTQVKPSRYDDLPNYLDKNDHILVSSFSNDFAPELPESSIDFFMRNHPLYHDSKRIVRVESFYRDDRSYHSPILERLKSPDSQSSTLRKTIEETPRILLVKRNKWMNIGDNQEQLLSGNSYSIPMVSAELDAAKTVLYEAGMIVPGDTLVDWLFETGGLIQDLERTQHRFFKPVTFRKRVAKEIEDNIVANTLDEIKTLKSFKYAEDGDLERLIRKHVSPKNQGKYLEAKEINAQALTQDLSQILDRYDQSFAAPQFLSSSATHRDKMKAAIDQQLPKKQEKTKKVKKKKKKKRRKRHSN